MNADGDEPPDYEPPPEVPGGTGHEGDSTSFLLALLWVLGGLAVIAILIQSFSM